MTPVDIAGLYWHFVDIIWIFLFPLLYLIDRHLGNSHARTHRYRQNLRPGLRWR